MNIELAKELLDNVDYYNLQKSIPEIVLFDKNIKFILIDKDTFLSRSINHPIPLPTRDNIYNYIINSGVVDIVGVITQELNVRLRAWWNSDLLDKPFKGRDLNNTIEKMTKRLQSAGIMLKQAEPTLLFPNILEPSPELKLYIRLKIENNRKLMLE